MYPPSSCWKELCATTPAWLIHLNHGKSTICSIPASCGKEHTNASIWFPYFNNWKHSTCSIQTLCLNEHASSSVLFLQFNDGPSQLVLCAKEHVTFAVSLKHFNDGKQASKLYVERIGQTEPSYPQVMDSMRKQTGTTDVHVYSWKKSTMVRSTGRELCAICHAVSK